MKRASNKTHCEDRRHTSARERKERKQPHTLRSIQANVTTQKERNSVKTYLGGRGTRLTSYKERRGRGEGKKRGRKEHNRPTEKGKQCGLCESHNVKNEAVRSRGTFLDDRGRRERRREGEQNPEAECERRKEPSPVKRKKEVGVSGHLPLGICEKKRRSEC